MILEECPFVYEKKIQIPNSVDPNFVKRWISQDFLSHFVTKNVCRLTDSVCKTVVYNVDVSKIKCSKLQRFYGISLKIKKFGVGTGKKFLKHVSDDEMSYFKYCCDRAKRSLLLFLIGYFDFKLAIGFWLMKKCREKPACPYRALLPETEVAK